MSAPLILNGREYAVRPVPFRVLKQHADVFEGRARPTMRQMGEIIFAALSRANPALTEAELDDDLDLANIGQAFASVCATSGLEERTSGEATPGSP